MRRILIVLVGLALHAAPGVCLAAGWKKLGGLGPKGPKTLQAETFAVANGVYFAVNAIFQGQSNLIRSKDGGTTWQAVPGLSPKEVAQSVVAREVAVYVATTGGIYLSEDGGERWTQIKKGMTRKKVTSIAAGKGLVVAVIDRRSLLCGEQGAKGKWTWKRAQKGLPRAYDDLGDVAIAAKTIFAGVLIDDVGRTAKVFRSTDRCKSFTPVMIGQTVEASDQAVIAGGVHGFAVSSDQGVSFSPVPAPTRQEGTYNFVVVGPTVYAGLLDVEGPNAILRLSGDLEGWDRLPLTGLPQTQIPPVFMVAGPALYLIANAADLYVIDVPTLTATR